MPKKISLSLAFTAAFLFLVNSPLADAVKIAIIFRDVTVPVFQWLVVLFFIVSWRCVSGEPWKEITAKGAVLGLIFSLYPLMLDTLRLIWQGAGISRMYVLYIKVFIFAFTAALSLWGAKALVKAGMFLPISVLSLYGTYFYHSSGHRKEAAILAVIFFASLYLGRRKAAFEKAVNAAKLAFARLATARTLIILVFMIALLIRLAFLFSLLTIEGPRYPLASDDGDTYDKYGWLGVSDPMIYIRESPHYFYVFYSLLLTAIYKIFGHSFFAAGAAQSAIGAILCASVYLFCFAITRNRLAAFLSGLGAALDPTLIHLFVTLNNEVLYIPFLFTAIMFLLFYKEIPNGLASKAFLTGGGILIGLASIIRTPGIGLVVLIVPWILFYGRNYSKSCIYKRFVDAFLFTSLLLITISPIIYINYRNTNEFFLVYNSRYFPGTTTPLSKNEWSKTSTWGEELVPDNKKFINLGMKDPVNKPLESIRAVLAHPAGFLKAGVDIIPKRMRNLFLWPNFGNSDPIYLVNPSRIKNRYASSLEFYSIILSISGIAIFMLSDIKKSHKILLFLVVIYYMVLHGIFYLSQSPRYAAPMWPFLYIAISFGAAGICKWFRAALAGDMRGAKP